MTEARCQRLTESTTHYLTRTVLHGHCVVQKLLLPPKTIPFDIRNITPCSLTPPRVHMCVPMFPCTRLDDVISMTKDEDGFIRRWQRGDDGQGHLWGPGLAERTWGNAKPGGLAPDEWVVPSELLRRNKKVVNPNPDPSCADAIRW